MPPMVKTPPTSTHFAVLTPARLRWLAVLAFGLALAAAGWRAPQAVPAAFQAPPAPRGDARPAIQMATMLPGIGGFAAAPSLTQLTDGRVAIAWLSGDPDKRQQAGIWFSILDRKGWQEPRQIANREESAGSLLAHVREIGAPVLAQHAGRLLLWYEASGIGGQRSQTIVERVSDDAGDSWQQPRRLQISPFGNNALSLSAPPLPLADGGLALPIGQHQFAGHGEWLRFAADGRIIDKARLPLPVAAGQPVVVADDAQHGLALLVASDDRQLQAVRSGNGGLSWQESAAPGVSTANSRIALTRLADGRLLLAGNGASGRHSLQLWLADASGKTWRAIRTIETADDGAAEFSDPSLLTTADGWVHLAYAWRQQGIRHLRFTSAWLDEVAP